MTSHIDKKTSHFIIEIHYNPAGKTRVIKILSISLLMTGVLTGCTNVSLPHDQHSKFEAAEKAKKCQELRQEIDDLKGKPARRGAHLEYYEDLCLNSQIDGA